jgi:hypothetical protein
VRRDQPADPVLWQAALLHDCGKAGVRPGLGLRAAGVLARRFRGFAPGRLGHYLRHETESVSRLRAAGAAREVWEAVAALAQPEGLPPAAAERARRLRIADDAE